jgi:hypothetical protein
LENIQNKNPQKQILFKKNANKMLIHQIYIDGMQNTSVRFHLSFITAAKDHLSPLIKTVYHC